MQLIEVKIVTHVVLHDRPDLKNKKQIAKAINSLISGIANISQLDPSNILDIREYSIPVIQYGDNIV